MRLHDPAIAFYVQSALESAQLLQVAARRPGLYTIRDLDWPVLLLDLALDRMRESDQVTPIYFCGFEPGYEASGYPVALRPRHQRRDRALDQRDRGIFGHRPSSAVN